MLLVVSTICSQTPARGEEPSVEIVTQNSAPAGEEPLPTWDRPLPRVQIFTQFHTGFDTNSRTTQRSNGTWFTNEQLTLSYQSPHRDFPLSIVSGAGAATYFGQRTNVNAFVDLSLSHRVTQRFTLSDSFDARYQAEPDLVANVGTNSFNGNYFALDNRLWANYDLTRRFSIVSSYNFNLVRYENAATAAFTDRDQHTFGEQLRFRLTRTTVLTGEYRFLLVDYVTAALDSTTHFFLAGVEHRFSPRLRAQARVGASIRSYDVGGSQTNPDFEASLDYALGNRTSLSWSGSYSIEQPQTRQVVTQKSFRTSLQLSHAFTRRISSSLACTYSHDENQQGTTLVNAGPAFGQDVFSILLSADYHFSRRLSFNVNYSHSEVNSSQTISGYARNRYSAGFSFSF